MVVSSFEVVMEVFGLVPQFYANTLCNIKKEIQRRGGIAFTNEDQQMFFAVEVGSTAEQ